MISQPCYDILFLSVKIVNIILKNYITSKQNVFKHYSSVRKSESNCSCINTIIKDYYESMLRRRKNIFHSIRTFIFLRNVNVIILLQVQVIIISMFYSQSSNIFRRASHPLTVYFKLPIGIPYQ